MVGVAGWVKQAADFDPKDWSLCPVWQRKFILTDVNCCPQLNLDNVLNLRDM